MSKFIHLTQDNHCIMLNTKYLYLVRLDYNGMAWDFDIFTKNNIIHLTDIELFNKLHLELFGMTNFIVIHDKESGEGMIINASKIETINRVEHCYFVFMKNCNNPIAFDENQYIELTTKIKEISHGFKRETPTNDTSAAGTETV